MVRAIQVRVGKRIQKEVLPVVSPPLSRIYNSDASTYGTVPPCSMRGIVIVCCVRIEQFARIVGVVASVLQPDGQIVFIQSLADEFRITAYSWTLVS